MELTCAGICTELGIEQKCCGSCHDDYEEGYTRNMLSMTLPDRRECDLCCTVHEAVKQYLQPKEAQNGK